MWLPTESRALQIPTAGQQRFFDSSLPHFRHPFALRLRMRHSSLYIYFDSQLSFHTLLTMSTLQRPRRIDLYQVRTGGR
jgi:hypothetical protein